MRQLGTHPLAESVTLTGVAAGDGFGAAMAAGDLDGDGVAELVVGAVDAGHGAGAIYVFHGPVGASVSASAATTTVPGRGALGWSVAVLGDLDGDGLAELAAGAPHADGGAEGSGAAYVWLGPAAASADMAPWLTVNGQTSGDALGARVGAAGDTDGDGREELLVGAWLADDSGSDAGAVGIFDTFAGSVEVSNASVWLTGESTGDWAGYGAAGGGDLDGDGKGDLIVGADGLDGAGNNAGGAYIVLGGADGGRSLTLADRRLDGEGGGDNAGHAVAWVPDSNGDGYDELLVGALANGAGGKRAGAAYLLPFGDAAPLGSTGAVILGSPGDHLGYSVAGLGDADGDGFGDILLGARFDSAGGADAGGAWLLFGPVNPEKDVDTSAIHVTGFTAEEAGFNVGSGGDVDGDGLADAFVGAPAADEGAGRVYVVRGVEP